MFSSKQQSCLQSSRMVLFLLVATIQLISCVAQKTPNRIEVDNQAFFLSLPSSRGRTSLEIPIQFRGTFYQNLANYNAWCNYHPTAVDIFGRSRFKRPLSEHTLENKNIAAFYSMLRVFEASPESFGTPPSLPDFPQLMIDRGLDPDDRSMNMSTPIGIGNREGIDTARLMQVDGWNAKGLLTSSQPQYAQPFADYTGYIPRNDPWRIRYPFRWQPVVQNNGEGFFFRQEHVVPQAGSALTFSLTPRDIKRRRVRSPYRRRNANVRNARRRDIQKLKRLARKVFKTSAELNERRRILAEFFDGKISVFRTENGSVLTIASALRYRLVGPALDLSADEDVWFGLGTNMAGYQAIITAWKEKRRIDAIRPTGQTMEFLFGNDTFEVWGGPGKSNFRIKAGEWVPYIPIMPHSEFPSGSACMCFALVEHALTETKGKEDIPYTVTIPKGSSNFYPGQIPEKDFVLKINKLSDWSKLCGRSRLFAGVHFEGSVKAGRELCKGVGTSSYKFVKSLVEGNPVLSWIDSLPQDVERFWEE